MAAPRPYTLIAELTHRCPLACPYCSNPRELVRAGDELSTEAWAAALEQAESIGVVQLHLTGGEPLLRADLEQLVAQGRRLGLYINLITSGVPLTRDRVGALADLGLDHVQLSFQDDRPEQADAVAGTRAFDAKVAAAAWITEAGLALTINVVLHRGNIARIGELGALAERLGARRLELAHAQYAGWALANRSTLLPDASTVALARASAHLLKTRLRGKIEVTHVLPDHFSSRPKACMDGWASRYILVAPDGVVLPCHAARAITHLAFDSVRDRPLPEIWAGSPALAAYRGEGWMKEPCRTCPERAVDHGGCRCQAFLLTGDAAATDPACDRSPHHPLVRDAGKTGNGSGTGSGTTAARDETIAPRRYLHRGDAKRS
jgi:PqqA peptide cyclase